MDGTTDVTQDPVKPGADFTYEWTVQSTPAVGMYHSHHDAVKQVPDGLPGAFIVGNEPVPAGVTVNQEQVMMLDDSGVIGYALNGKSFPRRHPSWPSRATGSRSTTSTRARRSTRCTCTAWRS